MSNMMNTALSGMMAASARLASAADNVANIDTQGYQRRKTDPANLAEGGVRVDAVSDGPDVEPTVEILDILEAQRSYEVNAKAFEAGADLWDVLMSIKRD